MAYSHGKKWNNELIEKEIKFVMSKAEITTMPTQSILKEVTGNTALFNAISKSGGSIEWSKKLGIEHKGIETVLGEKFETYCKNFIIEKFDFEVESMKRGHPYDLIVNKNIKIDVKASRIYRNKLSFFTFNLEKQYPTCDIFVAYCISDDKKIIKTYVIPSKVLSGITQLSIGINKSKYDPYLDKWDLLIKYDEFYKTI